MQELNYRDILENEFDFRQKNNPAYSLRAFARDLNLNPSQLSNIRKGTIGLSSKKSLEVAKKIGLSEKESMLFRALVEKEHGRSLSIKNKAQKHIEENIYNRDRQGLTIDGFKLISDWEHFAILSAIELDGFDGSILWPSQKLNLEIRRVEEAIKRLLQMGLVDFKNGKLVTTGQQYTTSHDISASALKKFHKQHLGKAIEAIDKVALDLRDITSMTMAIDIKKLPLAKEMIKEFRRQLCKVLETGDKNEVYNLNIQLVPLKENTEPV